MFCYYVALHNINTKSVFSLRDFDHESKSNYNPKGKNNEINLINSMAIRVRSWTGQLCRSFGTQWTGATSTGHV
jgi:hypothetical protein